MNKLLAGVIIICQICGCTPVLQTYRVGELFPDGQSLWEIRIIRADEQLFAGLLAVDHNAAFIEAVLLDGTGIKLLEEKVLASGEVKDVKALPAVRNKRLAPMLGEGLHRLFYGNEKDESGEPCRWNGLFQYCYGLESSGHLVKLKKLGPLKLWRVDYFINNEGLQTKIEKARLDSGWLSPSLVIRSSGGE